MWHGRRTAGQYRTGNKGQTLDPSGAAGHSSGMLKAISAMGNGPACPGQQPSCTRATGHLHCSLTWCQPWGTSKHRMSLHILGYWIREEKIPPSKSPATSHSSESWFLYLAYEVIRCLILIKLQFSKKLRHFKSVFKNKHESSLFMNMLDFCEQEPRRQNKSSWSVSC